MPFYELRHLNPTRTPKSSVSHNYAFSLEFYIKLELFEHVIEYHWNRFIETLNGIVIADLVVCQPTFLGQKENFLGIP